MPVQCSSCGVWWSTTAIVTNRRRCCVVTLLFHVPLVPNIPLTIVYAGRVTLLRCMSVAVPSSGEGKLEGLTVGRHIVPAFSNTHVAFQLHRGGSQYSRCREQQYVATIGTASGVV